MDPFCYLCFIYVFAILSCLFLSTLWLPAGNKLTSCLFCAKRFLVSLSLSHTVSWASCAVDCIYQFLIFAFWLTLRVGAQKNRRNDVVLLK